MVIIAKWLLTLDLTSVSRRVGLVYSRWREEELEGSRKAMSGKAAQSHINATSMRHQSHLKAC